MDSMACSECEKFFNDALHAENPFVHYMDYLIERTKKSRKVLIEQSGLSYDFMVKVLKGKKRTTEPDYLIALCLTMGVTVSELCNVLKLASFAPLQHWTSRERNILTAFEIHQSVAELNASLVKSNSPALKGCRFRDVEQESVPAAKGRTHKAYEVVGRDSDELQDGPAPFDFYFMSELTVKDRKGKIYYLQVVLCPSGEMEYAVKNQSLKTLKQLDESGRLTDEIRQSSCLEWYDSLIKAEQSKFFELFVKLDYLLDLQIEDNRRRVNDTRYAYWRVGASYSSRGLVYYAEIFNMEHPERQEYCQIVKCGDEYTYSASHTSYFMQMQMDGDGGVFYKEVFGKPEPQYYLFSVHSLDRLGDYQYLRPLFSELSEKVTAYENQVRRWAE